MTAAAPEPRTNQGQPARRIDGRAKVTGDALYAADFQLPGLAHAVLVTSDIARGEVVHMDSAHALGLPGVLAVLTHGDMEGVETPDFNTSSATSLGPLHRQTIHHDGQIVALVVAETALAAAAAAGAIKVEYRQSHASASLGSPGVEAVPAAGNVERYSEDPAAGDFDQAWGRAAARFTADYATSAETHNPIELFSTTCEWRDGKLLIYEPTQNVYGLRAELARQLRIPVDRVRVVSPYIGGGFGSKGPSTPRTAIVAVAARRLGRPVRCVVTRRQAYTTTTYRAETRQRIRIGAEEDGRIGAFSHEGWELTSRIDDYVVGGVDTTARMYGYGAVHTRVHVVRADRQTPGYMRSPPETPYMFALESAIDELAAQLRIDPVELRRRNDTAHDPVSGKPFSSRSLMRCYDEAGSRFGWNARDARPGAMRDGDWLVGWGCATAAYPTHIGAAAARVRLDRDGRVLVASASHEIGTGIRTVAAQVAAEQLGVSLEAVDVEMGDTRLPPAPVSGGSCSTASVCSAVLKACASIRSQLIRAVSADADGSAGFAFVAGQVVGPSGQRTNLPDALQSAGVSVMEAYAEFVPQGAPADAVAKLYHGTSTLVGGPSGPTAKFAFGAEFVEVRIHRRTREIRVPRMVGAFTAGRIINPRTARSQLMGGMIWGLGAGLLEETQVDGRNARYVNRDLQDYLVPVNADVRGIDVILVPEHDDSVNPAGVKGLGELGNVGTTAALANAIYHATGRRIRRIPIRLDDLLPES